MRRSLSKFYHRMFGDRGAWDFSERPRALDWTEDVIGDILDGIGSEAAIEDITLSTATEHMESASSHAQSQRNASQPLHEEEEAGLAVVDGAPSEAAGSTTLNDESLDATKQYTPAAAHVPHDGSEDPDDLGLANPEATGGTALYDENLSATIQDTPAIPNGSHCGHEVPELDVSASLTASGPPAQAPSLLTGSVTSADTSMTGTNRCPHCGETHDHKPTLSRHIALIHGKAARQAWRTKNVNQKPSGVKPFTCPVCGTRYPSSFSRAIHIGHMHKDYRDREDPMA